MSNKQRSIGKILKITTLIVVVLCLAAAAGFAVQQLSRSNQIEPPPQPESVTKAQQLQLEGNVAEAEKSIKDSLADSSKSADERYWLYIQLGQVAVDKGDTEGTLAAYLEAEKIKQTFDVVQKIGSVYEVLGNKDKAIEYYKKALLIVPANNPLHDRIEESLKEMIHNLGGQV